MRLGRYALIMLSLLASLALGGCASIGQPVVRQPRVEPTEQEVTKAAQQFLPVGAKITSPLTAKPASAFVETDIDGDGSREIVVLYKNEADLRAGGLLLKNVKGAWQSLGTVDGSGHDVDLAMSADLLAGGAPELLLGLSDGAGLSSRLSVYRWQDGKEMLVGTAAYSQAAVGDVNQDGRAELVTLEQTTIGDVQAPATSVKVLAATDAGLKTTGQDTIDGYPEDLLLGNAAPDRPGIFVETLLGAHSGCTELLFADQTGLTRAFPDPYSVAFKPYPLPSADVNGDGIVEIGGFIQPPGTEDLAMVEIPWVQTWQHWDGSHGLAATLLERYADYNAGFTFDIPAEWAGKFTVRRATDPVPQVEFLYLGADGRPAATLLTLRQYARAGWSKAEAGLKDSKSDYDVLAERGDQVLVGIFPANQTGLTGAAADTYQSLRLTPARLKQLFEVLPD